MLSKVKICACGRTVVPRHNSTLVSKCPKCLYADAVASRPKRGVTKSEPTKKSAISKAMAKADMYFSQYIRLREAKVSGGIVVTKDIITGKYFSVKRLDNGHLYSRAKMAIRYNEDNCHPQNRSSNRFKGEADHDLYEMRVIAKIGEERVNHLKAIKNDTFHVSIAYFESIAEEYEAKVKELQAKLGVKVFKERVRVKTIKS